MFFTLKYMPQLTTNREIKRVFDIHATVHVQGILASKLLDTGAWMYALIANPSGLQSFVLYILGSQLILLGVFSETHRFLKVMIISITWFSGIVCRMTLCPYIHAPYSKILLSKREFIHKDK